MLITQKFKNCNYSKTVSCSLFKKCFILLIQKIFHAHFSNMFHTRYPKTSYAHYFEKKLMLITQKYSGNSNDPMTLSNQKIDDTSYKKN